ncbi:MAG: glycosyltransferase [Bacteroidetes bacterium]|nr:MAG: glycosyltransferase [Bacteroidota bacterium]
MWIGGNIDLRQILSREFSDLNFLPLPGYEVKYSGTKRLFGLKILMQVPKILLALHKEHKWLKKIICDFRFDAVISDNRYGFYSKKIPSIFITHQLFILSGMNSWIDDTLRRQNFKFLKKFQECWVPDVEKEPNLTGKLAHYKPVPKNVRYIGPISRFQNSDPEHYIYEIAIILSGPEPQRTIWEKILLNQIRKSSNRILLVRGLPDAGEEIHIAAENIEIINYLGASELQGKILRSEWIVCRSGYSSIMDLVSLQKKAVLVPTPGQTEQEYLAKHLLEKGMFYSTVQENFDLLAAIESAKKFNSKIPDSICKMDEYKNVLRAFVSSLQKKRHEYQ